MTKTRFQSLFCWMINTKYGNNNNNMEKSKFQSLFCWMINTKFNVIGTSLGSFCFNPYSVG